MPHDASWLGIAGRLLIAAYYLASAVVAISAAERKHHIELLTGFKVPFPALAYWIGMALMWTGSLLLASGWHADIGIYCLIVFSVLANALYNRFWTAHDPRHRHFTRMLLLANLGVLGGMLAVLDSLP